MIKFDDSYLLYNAILILAAFFSYLAEKLDSKPARLVCRFFVFLILFIPAALRYQTGTDYNNYIDMYNNPDSLGRHEFLWRILNDLIHWASLEVQWLFVFSAVLIYWPLCFGLKRKYYSLSIILYVILTFYFKSYNILRQMIAVSFCLCSLVKFEEKHYVKSLLYILIGYGFHSSALLFIPCIIVCCINIENKYLPTILLFFCILALVKFNAMEIAMNLMVSLGIKYAKYLKRVFYLGKTEVGTGLGIIANLLFSFLAVFMYSTIKKKNPEKKVALNLSIIYIASYYLAAQFVIMGRLRDLFIMSPLLIAGYAIDSTGKYRKIVLIFLLCLNILLFEKSIGSQNRHNYSNSIYPYYSIFYEGFIE